MHSLFRIPRPFFIVAGLLWIVAASLAKAAHTEAITQTRAIDVEIAQKTFYQDMMAATDIHAPNQCNFPPHWLIIPFIVLLLMIATGPLLYAKFWRQHYAKVATMLSIFVLSYYLLVLQNSGKVVEAVMEYVQFTALITALYMVSGGMLINVHKQVTPLINLGMLCTGAVIANFIGTTGASMLLIRPYIRLNQERIKAYHIVFFIFVVSNVGGALTPIGDPPLFLGFLSGVPFFWTLKHNILPWLVALSLLGGAFYYLDRQNTSGTERSAINTDKPVLHLMGKRNLIWFSIIISAVFLDPNIFSWVPALHYNHHSFSFVREFILLGVAWLSYRTANKHVFLENEFNLAPLKEVVIIFIGIFGTMIPALQLVGTFAESEAGQAIITHNTLYWGAGIFSSILDNAPTYLNFSAASMAVHGAHISTMADVEAFAAGNVVSNSVIQLKAISIASVFFGAMTYIGNGPNFMVKAIAEQLGICMPSFAAYIVRFSIPLLLPVLVIVWLLFFAFV